MCCTSNYTYCDAKKPVYTGQTPGTAIKASPYQNTQLRREKFQTSLQFVVTFLRQTFISGKYQDGTKDTYVERYDLGNFRSMPHLQIDYI